MVPQPRCPSPPRPEEGQTAEHLALPQLPGDQKGLSAQSSPSSPPSPRGLVGWLLKRNVAHASTGLANVSVNTAAQGLFWRRRFFELGRECLEYWASEEARACQEPDGRFPLEEVDCVLAQGSELQLHFAGPQTAGLHGHKRSTLCLVTASNDEADLWAAAVRKAVAARLRAVLPSTWTVDLAEGLSANAPGRGPVRGPATHVTRVSLPSYAVQAMQLFMDHSFVCKWTKDRRGDPMPLRLEVARVESVQNTPAWVSYTRSAQRIRSEERDAQMIAVEPELMTSTFDPGSGLFAGLDAGANEHWLWHGTPNASADGIAKAAFRMDLAGTHRGSMYGKAVYLAECCSKADEYAEVGEDGLCCMLLCRSLLGAVLVDGAKQPAAEIIELCKRSHNSLCADRWSAVGTFREFVLYDSTQVYPAYVIYYRRVMQGKLLQELSHAGSGSLAARQLVPHVARLAEHHPDQQVRYQISLMIATQTEIVFPALIDCLQDERSSLRRVAASALGHIAAFTNSSETLRGEKLFSQESKSPKAKSRGKSKKSTKPLPPTAAAVPALAACLSDPSEPVRKAALLSLAQIGAYSCSAVDSIILCLGDASEDVRREAITTVKHLGESGCGERLGAAVPVLVVCLRDSSVNLRKAVLGALGSLGSQAAPAVPALIDCLNTSDEGMRKASAAALERLGAHAADAVPALGRCLEDANVGVRTAACIALGKMKEHATPCVRALVGLLRDSNEEVRRAVATALGTLGSLEVRGKEGAALMRILQVEAVPELVRSLRDGSEEVRKAVAVAIGQLHVQTASAIPQLVKCMKDSNEDVRTAVAEALGRFGPAASSALPSLTQALSDSHSSVRLAAATAIGEVAMNSQCTGRLAAEVSAALASLTERLKDPNLSVKRASALSLDQIRHRTKQAEHSAQARPSHESTIEAL